MAGIPQIDRKEIDKLASEWCKAKHVVVMLDDVAKQFACDCSNIVLKNYLESVLERVAAKKAAGAPAPVKKSSLVLTDM